MSDFIESILQSVDIIIDKRLEDVAYDSTIICTIIDDSDKKNGKYRVSDGSVTYVAYSDQNNYKKGDQIRMSVPMGDFSQKKFILGKYVTDSDIEPITYVSPVDTVLNISGNFANGITGSILANGEVTEKELWGVALDEKIISLQSNNLYNTIVLSCNFKTDLANYQMTSGNYGLRLDFVTRPSLKSEHVIINRITLDSSEMFGNPYLFAINSPQAKVIKLDTFGIVEGMSLKLYQKRNFRDDKENLIPTYNGQLDNIFVNNIAIGMGCDLTLLEDNKLQLYADDGSTYKYSTHTDETNLKTMGILWINKDDENRYVGFSDGIYDPTYDELEYLEKSKVNARLVKYKGKEGVPPDEESLNLAANIDEAAAAINKAVNVVNRDLVKVLREFQTMMSNITAISNNIGLLLNASDNSKYLGGYTSDIASNLSDLKTVYKNILQYGYEKINPSKENALTWNEKWETNYHNLIESAFGSIQKQINWLLSTQESENESGGCAGVTIDGIYSGYKSIYDSFKIRIDKIMAMMWGHLNKAPENYSYLNTSFPESFFKIFKDNKEIYLDYNTLQGYKEKTDFPPYKEPDLSSYDNKYCIYWYRYEKGYKTPASEQLLPEEWRRLILNDTYQPVENLTEEQFNKGIFYILENNKYIKATEWKEKDDNDVEITYYKINEEKINIGLPSIYYYTEDLDKKWKYERTTKYREDLQYYNDEFNLINNPTETDVVAGKYYVKVCMNDDGKPVHDLKPSPGNGTLTQYMQHDLAEEKYMVVLFYNHTMYKSNELVFTNEDVIPDKTTLDKGDILIFEHLNNSADNYQSYNITNYLMDERDRTLNRQLRCHYDGLLAKDNAFIGGQIYWYVPNQSTMITVDETQLLEKSDFIIDETRSKFEYQPINLTEPFENRPTDQDLNKKTNVVPYTTGKYYIENPDGTLPKYILSNESYSATTSYFEKILIETCYYKTINGYKKENAEQEKYEWDKWEYKNENSDIDNRDFWYRIKPYYQDSAQNNYIKCEFIQSEDIDSVFGQQLFTFGVAGTSGTKYTLAITKAEGQTSTTDTETLPLRAQLKDFNNNVLDFTIATKESFTTTWDFIPGDVLNNGSIYHISRNNVEGWFEAGAGSYGIIRTTARVNITDDKIPEAPTDGKSSDAEYKGATRQIDLVTLHVVPWALGEYYIDGTTQIIYNSYGTIDNNSMYNNSYKLYPKNDIVENGNVIFEAGHKIPDDQVTWALKLYAKDQETGKFVELTDGDPNVKYMPKLFDNTLIPAPLYLNGLDCYAVVEASVNGQITWKQPIIIMQNRYPSPMLNSWDGTFEINEENGTIMSTMVGAGRKESIDNTFSGVLMGDVYDGGSTSFNPENKTGLGIYGFHHGAQSFGFNIDGTAFLGKANKGRIIFNGNSGQIASASYVSTSGNSGMCIDLDDGYIHMIDATGNLNNGYTAGGTREIKISVKKPYFQIKVPDGNDNSKTKSLIYVSDNAYYLQTADFKQDTSGVKIDLKNGRLDAYNFIIDAWNDSTEKGLYLNSNPAEGQSYFRVGVKNGDEIRYYRKDSNSNALNITAENFKLRTSTIYLSDTVRNDLHFEGKLDTPISNISLALGIGTAKDDKGNEKATAKFGVTKSGALYATSGRIGGWSLGDNILVNHTYNDDSTERYRVFMRVISKWSDADSTAAFGAYHQKLKKGETSWNSSSNYDTDYNFYVRHDGTLKATKANIEGTITANYGTIGGWTINPNSISRGATTLGADGEISGASITGGSIAVGDYFKVSTTACVEMSNSVGFFTMGRSNATNPYVSALNVAYTSSAISFRTGTAIGDPGSQFAAIGPSDGNLMITTPSNGLLHVNGSIWIQNFLHVGSYSGQTCQVKVQTYTGKTKFLAFYRGVLVGVDESQWNTGVFPDYSD